MKKISLLVVSTVVGAITSSMILSAPAFAAPKKAAKKSQSSSTSSPARKRPLVEQADENMSGQGYGMAGCGLGSIAFGPKKGMIQIVAATLNATGYQTFGISTGTSNCKPDMNDTQRTAALFITVNRDTLAKDISRGNGEALENFSEIVGCGNARALGGKLQQNFNRIFPKQDSNAEASGREIFKLIKDDAELSKNCIRVS
jgi:hypothetical protein